MDEVVLFLLIPLFHSERRLPLFLPLIHSLFPRRLPFGQDGVVRVRGVQPLLRLSELIESILTPLFRAALAVIIGDDVEFPPIPGRRGRNVAEHRLFGVALKMRVTQTELVRGFCRLSSLRRHVLCAADFVSIRDQVELPRAEAVGFLKRHR